ncbi:MAG: hypothetical protein HC926_01005 [Synechococcaceae cyanobacterium SM2_3_60]|nr:hypothetical protein [Synechococcaceae cyanobacterium SM2_3_60]
MYCMLVLASLFLNTEAYAAPLRPEALQVFAEPLALPQDTLAGFQLDDVEICDADCNHRFFRLRYSHADGRCYIYSGSWAESPRYSLQYVVPTEIALFGWAYFNFGYLDRLGNFYEPSSDAAESASTQPPLRLDW